MEHASPQTENAVPKKQEIAAENVAPEEISLPFRLPGVELPKIQPKDKQSIISQRELKSDTSTFAVALRNVVRQDPDCILIGELREMHLVWIALIPYAWSGALG